MLKRFSGQRFNDAFRKAVAGGLKDPKQIRSNCRRHGCWVLLCEVPA